MRPLGKLDLCHSFRFHPVNVGCIHITVKRIAIGLQSLEYLPDFLEHRLIESGSRLANMNQPALLVIQPEHDRPEILPAALRIGVTADYAIDSLRNLDLQPLLTAPFFVVARALLRENPLQTFLLGHLE